MTLDLARIGSPTGLPAAAHARDDGSAAAVAHSERVTVSAEGRQASRELGPPPKGNVRWYRAATLQPPARPAPANEPASGWP